MSILSRYVKRNALFAIIFAVLGIWLLQIVFAYLGELEDLSDSYTMGNALGYIFYRSPYFLEQFIPTGALLGSVVGLGLLANNSELVVMQASGISKFRIVGWVLQPAVLFVLLALAVNQFVLPITNHLADLAHEGNSSQSSDEILSVQGYWTVQPRYTNKKGQIFADGSDILYIDYADINGAIGLVKRWHLDNQGNLQSASVASGGHYLGTIDNHNSNANTEVNVNPYATVSHQWQLNDLSEIDIGSAFGTSHQRQLSNTLSLPIEPDSVYLLTRDAEDLSLTQLYDHYRFMRSQGNRSLEHELAFWQKLLSPLSVLSLVIVACSFVFGSLRTHSLGLRVVVALLFGLFFSYMQDLVGFVSLATGISPLLMVLLPIIISALFGIWLLQRKR